MNLIRIRNKPSYLLSFASSNCQHTAVHRLSVCQHNYHIHIMTACALHWRHNDHDGVSNHQPHGCLLNRLFRRRSKKTSNLRVTGICVGNTPGPVNSPHKGPVTRKCFHLMTSSWSYTYHNSQCQVHFSSFPQITSAEILSIRLDCVFRRWQAKMGASCL